MSFNGNIVIFCNYNGNGCYVYSWSSGSNQYTQAYSLSSWNGVTDMNLSPDGVYCCLVGHAVAQIYKKNSGDYNYVQVSLSNPGITFVKCDISNSRAVFVGQKRIRILEKQSNGNYADIQNITTVNNLLSVKISYFNNWIFAGTTGNELLIYISSGSSYVLSETISSLGNYVSDIDVSYDAKTLLIAVFKSKFKIYGFACTLIPHCITCGASTFCD